tara:strand:+ start:7302 stop:8501 length:1200 start_codon:yes stop_codon:yes gene_type:complete
MASDAQNTGLWIAAESTFATDPDTDGSDYTAVPVTEPVGFPAAGKTPVETHYATGRNRATSPIAGAGTGEVSFKVPFKGLSGAAGDSTNASSVSDDYLDLLLKNAWGNPANTEGDLVPASPAPSSSGLDLTDVVLSDQDLVALIATGATMIQWRRLGGAPEPFTLDRNWDTTATASDVVYGTRMYRGDGADGSSLSVVVANDGTYTTLHGGRISALKLTFEAGLQCVLDISMRFDSRTINDTAKSGLPAHVTTTHSPIIGVSGGVWWNGASVSDVASCTIDWQPNTVDVRSVAGANGRSDIALLGERPRVTISASHATSFETDADAATQGNLMIQFGVGTLSGGVVNAGCFFAEGATLASQPGTTDDGGLLRKQLDFQVDDHGEFVSGTDAHYWTLARC